MEKLASMLKHFKLPKPETRAEMAARAEAYDREQKAALLQTRIKQAHIPARYLKANISECDESVKDYARSLIKGGSGWLLLTGKNGRGKTHQAAAVLRALAPYLRVEFSTMQQALEECKRTFSGAGSENQVTEHYRNVPLLLLDDFGKENPTDWSLPLIFSIIDGRYKALKPTIITTNMDAKQLIGHLSKRGETTLAESVISRLSEAQHVEITGSDRRRA